MKHNILIPVIYSLMLIGCGGEDGGESDNFQDGLVGTWINNCVDGTAGVIEFTDIVYSGTVESCEAGLSGGRRFSAVYEIVGKVELPDGKVVHAVDYVSDFGIVIEGILFIEDDRLYLGFGSEGSRPTQLEIRYLEKM